MSFINIMHSFIHTYALFFTLETPVKDKIFGVSLVRVGRIGVSSLIRFAHKWLLPGLGAQTSGAPPSFNSHTIITQDNRHKAGYLVLCAGRENRTPVLSLARTCHTTKLYPQKILGKYTTPVIFAQCL